MRKLNFDNQNCYCRVLLSVVDSKNRHKIEPYFDNFYDNLVIFTESATARFGTRKLIFGILTGSVNLFINLKILTIILSYISLL